jgi:hypothetical protein
LEDEIFDGLEKFEGTLQFNIFSLLFFFSDFE